MVLWWDVQRSLDFKHFLIECAKKVLVLSIYIKSSRKVCNITKSLRSQAKVWKLATLRQLVGSKPTAAENAFIYEATMTALAYFWTTPTRIYTSINESIVLLISDSFVTHLAASTTWVWKFYLFAKWLHHYIIFSHDVTLVLCSFRHKYSTKTDETNRPMYVTLLTQQ